MTIVRARKTKSKDCPEKKNPNPPQHTSQQAEGAPYRRPGVNEALEAG